MHKALWLWQKNKIKIRSFKCIELAKDSCSCPWTSLLSTPGQFVPLGCWVSKNDDEELCYQKYLALEKKLVMMIFFSSLNWLFFKTHFFPSMYRLIGDLAVPSFLSPLIGVSDFNSKRHYVIERKSNTCLRKVTKILKDIW